MNKIGFIFSCILTLIGIIGSFVIGFIRFFQARIFPLNYSLDYTFLSFMSIFCVVIGFLLCFYFYKKEPHSK